MPKYPVYRENLFSRKAILRPYPHYKKIRNLGPVVRLKKTGLLLVGRYEDVNALLRNHRSFSSAKSVFLNTVTNKGSEGSSISTDPPVATKLRKALIKPMMPKPLKEIEEDMQRDADQLIDRLIKRGSFNGVKDFAWYLPVKVVSNLVGLPEKGREKMLRWAAAGGQTSGPIDFRFLKATPTIISMLRYFKSINRADLKPNGWTARLFDAADRGEISEDDARQLFIDYSMPSLETTISGTAQFLYRLGRNPQVWEEVKKNPELVRNVFEEALRIESPFRGFSRVTTEDVEIDGVLVSKGSRIWALYASANHDERFWDAPETYDIHRKNLRKHLGFGMGIHQCAGQHLARLEMTCLLKAMIKKVDRIEVSNVQYAVNNTLRAIEHMDVTFH